eukprot:668363_1
MSTFEQDSFADVLCTDPYLSAKLNLKLIRKLMKIGKACKQSGCTILNTIFEIESLYQQSTSNSDCLSTITNTDVIGCFLLSSKYFESGYTKLKPRIIQTLFPSYTIQQINEMEMECIKKLDYNVDKLLVHCFNFWSCTDRIIFDFKSQFRLTEKYYLKLCGLSQKIALQLFYTIGHDIDDYDDKSLAGCIILCGYNEIKSNRTINNVIEYLVKISRYKTTKQLMTAAKELKALISTTKPIFSSY